MLDGCIPVNLDFEPVLEAFHRWDNYRNPVARNEIAEVVQTAFKASSAKLERVRVLLSLLEWDKDQVRVLPLTKELPVLLGSLVGISIPNITEDQMHTQWEVQWMSKFQENEILNSMIVDVPKMMSAIFRTWASSAAEISELAAHECIDTLRHFVNGWKVSHLHRVWATLAEAFPLNE